MNWVPVLPTVYTALAKWTPDATFPSEWTPVLLSNFKEVIIVKECSGWFCGYAAGLEADVLGMFPATYIKLHEPEKPIEPEMPVEPEIPIIVIDLGSHTAKYGIVGRHVEPKTLATGE